MIFNTCPKNQQSGFSLVETLVSITILLIVITGPLSISSQAAKSTSFSSEQVVAFFLAQEGLEIAQKGRDDFILRNFLEKEPVEDPNFYYTPWSSYFIDTTSFGKFRHCFHGNGCPLEIITNATGEVKTPTNNCGNNLANCKLYYNQNGDRSRYTYTPGTETNPSYTRVIRFQPVVGADQIRVTSEVTWRTGSLRAGQRVVIESYLFKVYDDN